MGSTATQSSRLGDECRAEVAQCRCAGESHDVVELGDQDVEDATDAGIPSNRQTPQDGLPDTDGAGAQRERHKGIRAPSNAAVELDRDPRLDDRGQGVQAGNRGIELPPTVVADLDRGRPVFDKGNRVVGV